MLTFFCISLKILIIKIYFTKECNSKENGVNEEDREKEKPKELPYSEPLTPEQVRWFYKDDVNKRWTEFCGYDSLRIENAWRRRQITNNENGNSNKSKSIERVVVRGGMYDVELENMKCVSIYWPGKLKLLFLKLL